MRNVSVDRPQDAASYVTAGMAGSALAPHRAYFAAKRATDLVVATSALVLLAPLLALVALAIKLESRGPALYRHQRVGERGERFTCYKFRSMHVDAAELRRDLRPLNVVGGPAFKAERDPRVTRLGRLLRVTSVDEIPQLYNVIRGHMSLVGPRPLAVEDFDSRHEIDAPETRLLVESRLRVKPGMTGLWQVSGRSRLSFEQWMRLDDEYIRRRSLAYDLFLLLRTIPAVVGMRGAM